MYILCGYFFVLKKRKHYGQRYFKSFHVLSSHLSTIYLIVCLGYRVLPEIGLTSCLRQRVQQGYAWLFPSKGKRGHVLLSIGSGRAARALFLTGAGFRMCFKCHRSRRKLC